MNGSPRYIMDTDICIYLLNGEKRVMTRVTEVGVEAISVAILTVGEIFFGAYNSARVQANLHRVRTFLSPPGPQVLPIDDVAAECCGRFKAALHRAGKPISDVDLFIAGIAASRGLTVVTNNTEHFERIGEIRLENWKNP